MNLICTNGTDELLLGNPKAYLYNPKDTLLRQQIYGAPHSRLLIHYRTWSPVDGLVINREETQRAGLSMARFFGKSNYEWMRFGIQFPTREKKAAQLMEEVRTKRLKAQMVEGEISKAQAEISLLRKMAN